MEGLGCPYCSEGDGFKALHPSNDRFICAECGHTIVPERADYECSCVNCKALKRRDFPARW
jgi:hypothetical protein